MKPSKDLFDKILAWINNFNPIKPIKELWKFLTSIKFLVYVIGLTIFVTLLGIAIKVFIPMLILVALLSLYHLFNKLENKDKK